jgi:uncharacterized protein (DUF433 family)
MNRKQRIVVDRKILAGKPIIKGTRISAGPASERLDSPEDTGKLSTIKEN